MLREPYSSIEDLTADYKKLGDEHKADVHEYIKRLLKIQRAEDIVNRKVKKYEKQGILLANENGIVCTFCGKPQESAKLLITGAADVYICDSCIDICTEVVAEARAKEKSEGQ